MTCDSCKKRWFCIAACPEINSALSSTYEDLPAIRKIITMAWHTGALLSPKGVESKSERSSQNLPLLHTWYHAPDLLSLTSFYSIRSSSDVWSCPPSADTLLSVYYIDCRLFELAFLATQESKGHRLRTIINFAEVRQYFISGARRFLLAGV